VLCGRFSCARNIAGGDKHDKHDILLTAGVKLDSMILRLGRFKIMPKYDLQQVQFYGPMMPDASTLPSSKLETIILSGLFNNS